eukprot:1196018-Prorocentrum_minimum.AAC.2
MKPVSADRSLVDFGRCSRIQLAEYKQAGQLNKLDLIDSWHSAGYTRPFRGTETIKQKETNSWTFSWIHPLFGKQYEKLKTDFDPERRCVY